MRLRFWLSALFYLCLAAEAAAMMPGDVLATFRDRGAVVAVDGSSLALGKPLIGFSAGKVGTAVLIENPLSTTPGVHDLQTSGGKGARYGSAVATLDGRVLVGDISGGSKTTSGGATLFGEGGGKAFMVAPQPTTFEQGFGTSVAITAQALAVGVPYWDGEQGAFYNRGIVQIYDASGVYLGPLDPPKSTELASFGFSLASTPEQLLVGAPDDDGTEATGGAAYLYGSDLRFRVRFSNPTPSAGDRFGQTLAISDNRVLIGAPFDDAAAQWAGAAYLFDLNGNLLQTFANPQPSLDDEFGSAVSFVGDNILIGAQREDTAGYDNGAAYLFSPDGRLLNTLLPPPLVDRPLDNNKQFGSSLAGCDQHVVAGAAGVSSTFILAGGSLLTPLGDANVDGEIGLADFGIFKEHFGMQGTMFDGNFDASGKIDLADFGRLKENFGKQLPAATTAVPEPATALLAVLGIVMAMGRRWQVRSLQLVGAAALSLAANLASAADYLYVPFSMPDAKETSLYGINELGGLAGSFLDQAGVERGFVVKDNVPMVLAYPGAVSTVVLGLNDNGVAVGGYTDASGKSRPFVWDGLAGEFKTFTLPEGYTGIAAGINNNGDVVGLATSAEVVDSGFRTNIAEQSPLTLETTNLGPTGTPTIYSDISSNGRIVGEYRDANSITHGIYTDTARRSPFDVPLATKTSLYGVNDPGAVVGTALGLVGGDLLSRGFVYSDLVFQEIAYPGALMTVPSGIANNGTIVGLFEDDGLHRTGFMAIPIASVRGDLNADGKVDLTDFGILKENFGKSGVAAVPEPSGWLLVCLGAATLIAFKMPRKSKRVAA